MSTDIHSQDANAPTAPTISASGVTKSFGAATALVRADLLIRPGEVHTLMGENGSGKSTLVKILSGVHRPDSGDVMVDGQPAGAKGSPAKARALGIATVFQEVLTVPGASVLDNVWLGTSRRGTTAAYRRERAEHLLEQLTGSRYDPGRPVDTLSLSDRQAICIVRALVVTPKLLVLDESTSALDLATRDRLFEMVRTLSSEGTSVLFVSHRMDEVFDISNVISVLRSGRSVAERLPVDRTSVTELVHLMAGAGDRVHQTVERVPGRVVLTARNIAITASSAPIDFELRAGELVGIAGLEGHGQDAFLNALRGAGRATGEVTRTDTATPDGAPTVERITDARGARRHGVAYVPRERRGEAIFEQLSIWENFGLPKLNEDASLGVVRPKRTGRRLEHHGRSLHIKMGHHSDAIGTLSGGNQQKVVLARSIADEPAVLLLNDPTRGIDINAKRDLYAELQRLCVAGLAVVILSSEVDELVDLVDRVIVFRDFEVSAEIDREHLTRSAIVGAYFGSAPVPSFVPEPLGGVHVGHDAAHGA